MHSVKVYTDIPITRRKSFHMVQDETGETVASFARWHEVMHYLHENDIQEYSVTTPNGEWSVSHRLDLVTKET